MQFSFVFSQIILLNKYILLTFYSNLSLTANKAPGDSCHLQFNVWAYCLWRTNCKSKQIFTADRMTSWDEWVELWSKSEWKQSKQIAVTTLYEVHSKYTTQASHHKQDWSSSKTLSDRIFCPEDYDISPSGWGREFLKQHVTNRSKVWK